MKTSTIEAPITVHPSSSHELFFPPLIGLTFCQTETNHPMFSGIGSSKWRSGSSWGRHGSIILHDSCMLCVRAEISHCIQLKQTGIHVFIWENICMGLYWFHSTLRWIGLNWHEVFGSPHGDEHMTNMTQGSKRAFARKVKGNMRSPIGWFHKWSLLEWVKVNNSKPIVLQISKKAPSIRSFLQALTWQCRKDLRCRSPRSIRRKRGT